MGVDSETGWQVVEVGRGSSEHTCPVHSVEQWLHFPRITFGPAFTRVSRDSALASNTRLNDRRVARLMKRCVLAVGLRSDLPEKDTLPLLSGYSLRAGFASSAEADEQHVQRSFGHASAEMTRRYRFRVDLTKAAGL